MFGREKKTYNISYTTESGFKETMEVDTKQLRDLIQQEKNDATFTKTPDGRMIADYKFKINNIRTPYLSGRDIEFFSPGISRADKYTNKASGYFIKDTRSNFKALAPGTDDILIFSSNEEAKKYFVEHKTEIENDYAAQRDSYFDLDRVVYRSIVHTYDDDKHSLNLSGEGEMFPKDNLYTFEDIANLHRVLGSYEDFNASHEYAQNLKFIRPTFSDFVTNNAVVTKDDMVRLNLDSFDPGFKSTMEHYVKSYPEKVNQDVIVAEEREKASERIKARFNEAQRSANAMAEDHGLVSNEADNQLSDDVVF